MRIELNLPVKDKPITQEWEEDEQFVKVLVPKYMIDETIEFFEKQIPKLVDMSHCNCGMALDNVWQYCPNCGQALKWGDVDERRNDCKSIKTLRQTQLRRMPV